MLQLLVDMEFNFDGPVLTNRSRRGRDDEQDENDDDSPSGGGVVETAFPSALTVTGIRKVKAKNPVKMRRVTGIDFLF